jgi:hypothetical protein
MGDTEKNPRVTFNEYTSEWLDDQYPAAMTDPEKVRMAVNDAMTYHRMQERLMDKTAELAVEEGELPLDDITDLE